jgi:hypothetical protein
VPNEQFDLKAVLLGVDRCAMSDAERLRNAENERDGVPRPGAWTFVQDRDACIVSR